LKAAWATIVLVVGGGFANPESAQLKRWTKRFAQEKGERKQVE